jgi:hypothetical protein
MQLAEGWDGTDQTVAKATQLVRESLSDPVVRLTAENIVRKLPERDKSAEIRAISRFVRKNIRYTNEGIETIKTPRLLLDEIRTYGKAVGDCDDHVILWLALHKVIGQKVRIKVVSQRKNKVASHIYGEVYNPDTEQWVADDTIKKNREMGWSVPFEKRTAEKTYGDGMEGFGMPGYQTVSQNGTWHPGGAGRFYVNPQQRPGIREGQLSVGRSLLPSNIQLRGADDLESEGVGFTLPSFGIPKPVITAAVTAPSGVGFDLSALTSAVGPLIEAGGKAAASYAAQKAAQKEAKRAAKEARAEQQRQAIAASSAIPMPGFVSSGSGGDFLKDNWQMLAVGGGLLALFLFMRR